MITMHVSQRSRSSREQMEMEMWVGVGMDHVTLPSHVIWSAINGVPDVIMADHVMVDNMLSPNVQTGVKAKHHPVHSTIPNIHPGMSHQRRRHGNPPLFGWCHMICPWGIFMSMCMCMCMCCYVIVDMSSVCVVCCVVCGMWYV